MANLVTVDNIDDFANVVQELRSIIHRWQQDTDCTNKTTRHLAEMDNNLSLVEISTVIISEEVRNSKLVPQIGDFVRTWKGDERACTIYLLTGPSPDALYDFTIRQVLGTDDHFVRVDELHSEGKGCWTYVQQEP